MPTLATLQSSEYTHDGVAIGDVAQTPLDFLQLVLGHEEPRTALVLREIERARRHARPREQREHPAADTAARPGHQHRTGEARAVYREAGCERAHFFFLFFFAGPCASTLARVGSPPSSASTKVPPWNFSVRGSAPGRVLFRISSVQTSLSSCGL